MAVAAAVAVSLAAEPPDSTASGKSASASRRTGAASAAPAPVISGAMNGLDQLLPVGKSAERVSLPGLDATGQLLSVTRIDKITRIDEENFALEGLRITSFDNRPTDPATERPLPTVIQIPRGTYHRPTRTLKSEEPCRITKPEFDLAGESLIYQSEEGIGVMRGAVRMVIYGTIRPVKKSN
jgi:hypothetical protein